MFGNMGDMMKQLQMLQKLMKDENFKAFISHPKMKELTKNPEFLQVLKSKDMDALKALKDHPKFAETMKDPEVVALLQKVNFKELLG